MVKLFLEQLLKIIAFVAFWKSSLKEKFGR